MTAVGWFQDPFGRHELRWYSQGVPTSLVRDGTSESHDRPVRVRRRETIPPLPAIRRAH